MSLVEALVCTECGRSFAGEGGPRRCPEHDAGGPLSVRYDEREVAETLDAASEDLGESLWQFDPILPTGTERVSLGAGATPVLDAPTLSPELGVSLRVKDETGNPTGSIKDRASAVLLSRAAARKDQGTARVDREAATADQGTATADRVTATADVVSCASTGNQAASVAAYAARAGLDCRVFVPADVPEGKAVQPLVSGADVYAVDGEYDDAFSVCRAVSEERGWHNCSPAVDPFGLEGLRTVGLELGIATAEAVPDWVAVPMGNGTAIAATWKGLRECAEHGVIDRTPRLLGVQAAGVAPIHRRFTGEAGEAAGTTADSIDVGRPHDAVRACEALEESGGTSVVVSDDAILAAERTLGRAEGLYVEPASAATVAGVEAALEDDVVDPGEEVVCVLTGSGLKDTASARSLTGEVRPIPADPGAVPDDV